MRLGANPERIFLPHLPEPARFAFTAFGFRTTPAFPPARMTIAMKHVSKPVAAIAMALCLASCGALQGPVRLLESGMRTFTGSYEAPESFGGEGAVHLAVKTSELLTTEAPNVVVPHHGRR